MNTTACTASIKNGVIPFVGYRTYRFTFIETFAMAFGPTTTISTYLVIACLRLYNGTNIIPLTGVVLTTNNPKGGASIVPLGEQNLLQAAPNDAQIYQAVLFISGPIYTYVDLTFSTPVIATSYAIVNPKIPTGFGSSSPNLIASFKLTGTNDNGRTYVPLDKKTRIVVNTASYFENKFTIP